MKPAAEVVEPQVPLTFPKPPSVRLFTLRLGPVMLALAVPVGAILRLPVVSVEPFGRLMDLLPEPLKTRLY